MWQPSLDSLRNVEQDEAGRLRAFRQRFGRGWDLDSQEGEEVDEYDNEAAGTASAEESLMDLISGAGTANGYSEKITEGKGEDGGDRVEMIKVMRDGNLVSVPMQNKKERRK